ncbi:MAG: thioredoxin family protein [Chloroflexi bacterium]|nr:thioredoxin family protein [Chloroflexota bacterium]
MIPLKDQDVLRQKFALELINPVKIEFFTQQELSVYVPGRQPCAYCKPAREMLQELAALSDLISLRVHDLEEAKEEARKYGVDKIPGILLHGKDHRGLKFYGLPGGTEFPAFVETIVDTSRGMSLLSKASKKALRKLKEDVQILVFVTPTCPYCPQMARFAYNLALESPRVTAEVIEVNEFPELAQRYQVRAVPLAVINDKVAIPGAVPENVFVDQVVKAVESPVAEPAEAQGPASPAEPPPAQKPIERGKRRGSGLIIP